MALEWQCWLVHHFDPDWNISKLLDGLLWNVVHSWFQRGKLLLTLVIPCLFLLCHHVGMCGFWWNIPTIAWIAMGFGLDIHVPVRMNCHNFGDSLMFSSSSIIRFITKCLILTLCFVLMSSYSLVFSWFRISFCLSVWYFDDQNRAYGVQVGGKVQTG